MKMKILNYIPLIMFSGFTLAETGNIKSTEIIEASSNQVIGSLEAEQVKDVVLPQLSFEAQQARAIELAKQSELVLKQEEEKRIADEKINQAQNRIKQEVGGNQLLLSQATAKVYLEYDFKPIWQEKNAVRLFLKEYSAFAVSGVSSKSARALQQILNTPNGLARDILLTDSFLDYLYYNKNVAKNANQWLYSLGRYSTKEPEQVHIDAWLNSVKSDNLSQFITNLIPRNHIYQEGIQKLFEMSSTSSINTMKAVKKGKGKSSNNVNAESSKSTNSVSFAKLALNIQRLRFIPSFNNGIFVNIPSYQLHYIRDGKSVLHSKVIVGRNERRTPVMFSKLSNVVVNPPWNVPASIKNKDLVPKMRRDPSYVESHGYEIIDNRGNKVNPSSINWEIYDNPAKNFPYHIRQKAGDSSALGRFKFNMPSTDAIYLHDTPSRGLFGKTDRALSSGCVRVAKSDELATLLLKEAGWSMQRKQGVLNSKKTTSVQVRSDNPVYLYYVTSWVEDGKIHTLPDIYRFDKNLPKISVDWEKVKDILNSI